MLADETLYGGSSHFLFKNGKRKEGLFWDKSSENKLNRKERNLKIYEKWKELFRVIRKIKF